MQVLNIKKSHGENIEIYGLIDSTLSPNKL